MKGMWLYILGAITGMVISLFMGCNDFGVVTQSRVVADWGYDVEGYPWCNTEYQEYIIWDTHGPAWKCHWPCATSEKVLHVDDDVAGQINVYFVEGTNNISVGFSTGCEL